MLLRPSKKKKGRLTSFAIDILKKKERAGRRLEGKEELGCDSQVTDKENKLRQGLGEFHKD